MFPQKLIAIKYMFPSPFPVSVLSPSSFIVLKICLNNHSLKQITLTFSKVIPYFSPHGQYISYTEK